MRSQPSPYPILPFHALRACSLVCSLVVAAVLSYFVYHLKRGNFKIPWTFLVLFGVALLSLLNLTLTLALHLFRVLSPLFNLVFNIFLLLLWVVGLSLLGWNMSGTLSHVCNSANWGSAAGIMICRLYKTLFSFGLFSTLSAIALVVLDLKVRKDQNSLGKYNQMRDSAYDLKPTSQAFSTGALGGHHEDRPEPWLSAGQEPADYNSRNVSRERVRSEHFGYTSPLEQTHYDAGDYANQR
ncbi:hypothetical protein EPUS_07939 [Endocarpon pusillum Z07020]|uniref:MARVEL domain-containing protein n=1 Tax=Endocarpon pusillum (strain Z07020 / HMAS-L-300199) TaxID=1263415 RepID=U1GX02_ENDPU|nr:uncharacterized protein EPUS_07939 [Endocarpon pusillum Z07020]ERF77033.1 hypothetical protein EPUS_07939 [Endocarpon pusillum Z07020]